MSSERLELFAPPQAETGPSIGLLSRESQLLKLLLVKFQIERVAVGREIADAAENSGGDWALDDDSVKAAVEKAHTLDIRLANLPDIMKQEGDIVIETPADETIAGYGARVTVDYGFNDLETYDMVTRILPDIDSDGDVTFITGDSPFGQALNGANLGNIISWSAQGEDSGRMISATVVSVDYSAQSQYFDQLIESMNEQIDLLTKS